MGEASRSGPPAAPAGNLPLQARVHGGPRTRQYRLIAEEVAAVYPDLVLHDPQTGRPQTVAYHLVNAMLLNEVQKQHHRIKTLEEQNKGLAEELAALKEQVGVLAALVGPAREAATFLARLKD